MVWVEPVDTMVWVGSADTVVWVGPADDRAWVARKSTMWTNCTFMQRSIF